MLTVLFNITDVRRSILRNLRPYDIARFLAATGCQITEKEREKFMNLVDDIFLDSDEIKILLDAGVKIILLGHQLHLLHDRLRDAKDFTRRYGNSFTIDLIAVAYCNPHIPTTDVTYALSSALRFTITDRLLEKLGSNASIAYSWLERDLQLLPCTNTSLAPYETPESTNIRLRLFKLNLRCLWFSTIDFVYPEEAQNIFDWSYDPDAIETAVMIISYCDNKFKYFSTRSCGR